MKPIYEPKGRAGEYADLALNIYTGCPHGCTYCYVPAILRVRKEDFHAKVSPRAGIVNAVCRQLEREQISGKLIHLCFTCDPYPAGVDTTVTREVIQAIKRSGNHVQLLTKHPSERDFDLLDDGDWFGVTISCLRYPARIEEPGAMVPEERLHTLAAAKARGIRTWVSAEPVLDPYAIFDLLRMDEYSNTYDRIAIGKLNHRPSEIDWKWFAEICQREGDRYGINYMLKEDLRRELEAES